MSKEEDAEQKKKYDLENRLIDFAVRIIKLVESLPKSPMGNHIAGQLLRSGTSPAPSYGEAQSAESRKDFIHKMRLSSNKVGEFMADINRKFLKFKALSRQPVMAVIEKNHLGRGLNLGWQGGNFGLWGPRRIFLAMCAPTFSELNIK